MSFCDHGSDSPAATRICALDEVDAGDHFRHGMLDLNPGVDLDEVEVARLIDDELDRRGIGILRGPNEFPRRVAHRCTRFGRNARARAFLDQLLMAPLHAAIAFPKVHDIAMMIGQHLHFDVPRVLDVLFEIDVAVAEGGLGLGPRLLQCRLERQIVRCDSHAATAAAGNRLDQHRKADVVRRSEVPPLRL